MNEQDFVTKKRESWDRLAALIKKANGAQGLRALNRDDTRDFAPLYRRASSDLAFARANAINTDLMLHLNNLVGTAHCLLFESEKSKTLLKVICDFYVSGFPRLLQKHFRYFALAFTISVIGGIFAYWLVVTHPDKLNLFIPDQFKDSVDAWKEGKVQHEASGQFSASLMTHNFLVGVMAFALGLPAGIPTVNVLFTNGATLGALAALMTQVHRHSSFWPGILPHGIAELTAIFICGGAGIMLGLAFLLPGRYTRRESLLNNGIDAILLLLGTIPLFIFAGIIEGMFSHLPLPPVVRLTFAGLNGIVWYLYLFMPRKVVSEEESLQLRNSM